jgi:membrane-bound metal-dependent hydrolase YbcI (DUF457 family)
MDLFTHVLFAYLITFGIWGPTYPQYIAAGALAGALPDADILLFPLARRFPLLRHHGITHSVVGVSLIAVGGALLGPHLIPGLNPLYLFLAMEGGGLSHIFLDAFTNFSVPPLAPFSRWEIHFDADRAVNFATMIGTLVAFVILLEERGTVPLRVWETTAWVLLALYIAYLVVRGWGRVVVERVRRREGYNGVIPSAWPWAWILVDETIAPDLYRIRWRPYHWGRGFVGPEHELSVPSQAPGEGPVLTEEEAIRRSFEAASDRSRFLANSYRFAEARALPNGFEVFWYSLEFTTWGRAAGILARIDSEGGLVELRTAWRAPRALSRGREG